MSVAKGNYVSRMNSKVNIRGTTSTSESHPELVDLANDWFDQEDINGVKGTDFI